MRSALAACGLFGVALMLAGCGGTGPTADNTTHAGTIHVRQEWVPGSLYVEGSYSYVRVEHGGDTVQELRLEGDKASVRLEPGTYRLVSFQRPCDGNCSFLDPPTDECSREIEIAADAELHELVRLTPGSGCTISD
jgi:hypothetical protein